MEELEQMLLKYALLNALRHDGKAQAGPIVNNAISEQPELKDRVKELYKLAAQVITQVNLLSINQQKGTLEEKWPELVIEKKKEREEKKLPSLRNVDKFSHIRTRFAPNPDGYLHVGQARPIILCKEYSRIYKGRFILRYEDTSPEVKAPITKAYEWILEDLRWLHAEPDEVYIQSDRLEIYYKYAEVLISKGAAYICTCPPEEFREKVTIKETCPCRELRPEVHLQRWKEMLDGTYNEGDAVVRIKTDVKHPNPAIRDWPALRIKLARHPRTGTKYRVWPLYNFSCGIDDHEMEISHIIRGKEHETNTIRQKYLYRHLKWEYPETINVGRVGLETGILSKSKIRAGVEKGLYNGWDDPRLGTLVALRRRGIQPEAINALMIEIGTKPVNATLSWGNIASANRAFIEPIANRYFFVHRPISLTVQKLPHDFHPRLRLHPDHPERGFREFEISPVEGCSTFIVSEDDREQFSRSGMLRLMGLFNVDVKQVEEQSLEAEYVSESYVDARSKGAPLIHWLPKGKGLHTDVVMPDASMAKGLSEPLIRELKPDTVIQFERFGFARIDSISEGSIVAYFTHK